MRIMIYLFAKIKPIERIDLFAKWVFYPIDKDSLVKIKSAVTTYPFVKTMTTDFVGMELASYAISVLEKPQTKIAEIIYDLLQKDGWVLLKDTQIDGGDFPDCYQEEIYDSERMVVSEKNGEYYIQLRFIMKQWNSTIILRSVKIPYESIEKKFRSHDRYKEWLENSKLFV
jgi:hypothetical protein